MVLTIFSMVQVLGVGKRKIYLDPSHISEISNANSRQKYVEARGRGEGRGIEG